MDNFKLICIKCESDDCFLEEYSDMGIIELNAKCSNCKNKEFIARYEDYYE